MAVVGVESAIRVCASVVDCDGAVVGELDEEVSSSVEGGTFGVVGLETKVAEDMGHVGFASVDSDSGDLAEYFAENFFDVGVAGGVAGGSNFGVVSSFRAKTEMGEYTWVNGLFAPSAAIWVCGG